MDHQDKKKRLFDCLDAAEKKLQGSCLEQKEIDNYNKRRKTKRDESIEKYKCKESIFKRPELPINKCLSVRKRPDYEANPHKYQHYTLSDISDTSDRMNASAAFSFLREMEERKQKEQSSSSNSDSQKIVFKNSTKLKPKDPKDVETEKTEKILGNKFVMKEYVVGEKRAKTKKIISKDKSSSSAKQLRLCHLNEDEEEDE